MKLKSTLRRFFFERVKELDLPRKSEEQKNLITVFRSKIRNLPPLAISPEADNTEKQWTENKRRFRNLALSCDPRNFLNWEVIRSTMFHNCKKEELEYLKSLNSWSIYKEAVQESVIGNSGFYSSLPGSSGNLVHHAYNFSQFAEAFPVDPKSLKSIFEFGGGYGSFCRLMYNLGFSGTYAIFDLPEFLILQEYFLKSLHIPTEKISFISDFSGPELTEIDLFVGTWSVSETPISFRQQIFNLVKSPRYYLIAFQEKFKEADNIKYFEQFKRERPNYDWKQHPIAHLPGQHYLFGHRK